MSDGDIDYSKYTLRELEEALAGIRRDQYPRNYANLRSAYEHLRAVVVQVPEPETVVADSAVQNKPTAWDRFWTSRPTAGIGGAFCLWWSFELFTGADSCSSGHRLMALLINAVCENLGHKVAAIIPLALGLVSLVYAVFPRRRAAAGA